MMTEMESTPEGHGKAVAERPPPDYEPSAKKQKTSSKKPAGAKTPVTAKKKPAAAEASKPKSAKKLKSTKLKVAAEQPQENGTSAEHKSAVKKSKAAATGDAPSSPKGQKSPNAQKTSSKTAKTPKTPKATKAKAGGVQVEAGEAGSTKTPKSAPSKKPVGPPDYGTMEEEESKLKKGSIKELIYNLLKEAGPEGSTPAKILQLSVENQLRDWGTTNAKALILSVLSKETLFVRMKLGLYSLIHYHPELATNQITFPKLKPGEKGEKKEKPATALKMPKHATQPVDTVGPTEGEKQAAAPKPKKFMPPVAPDPLAAAKKAHATAAKQLETATHERIKAEEALAQLEAKLEADPSASTPSKAKESDTDIVPAFQVPQEAMVYGGPPDDRKALLKHKRLVQQLQEEVEQKKLAWIREQKALRAKERQAALQQADKAQSTRKKLVAAVSQANKKLELALKAHNASEAALDREQLKMAKLEDKEKEKAEKLKKKEEEKAERERKRLEAIEAKRYPIEDSMLMEELLAKGAQMTELKLPEFGAKEDGAQMARLLFVADVTQRFPKELGIKPLSMEQLQAALEGKKTASGRKTKTDEPDGFELVSQMYQGLLAAIMEDLVSAGVASRMERRWNNLLDAGTWPEILRRYILLSHKIAQEEEDVVQLVDDETAQAARDLSRSAPEDLTVGQHLMLLENLCNEALATSELRTALAKRLEEAEDVLRDLRTERQEDRKQIREVEAALKEERKQRREEEAAKKAELAQLEGPTGAAGAEGGAGAEAVAPAKPTDEAVARTLSASLNVDEEQEPSWELPAELQKFTSNSDDRKALLEWRQKVQAEKQRLEKAKLHWHAEKRRRDREREKQQKAEMEARKAKQKELERLQDVLGEKEEAYERELNKYIVRQAPMGLDRYHRRYWWGIGGARGTVYIEADDGCWAKLTTVDDLEELLDSLDKRGVREADLIENLDKHYHGITKAMKRAAGGAERLKKAEEKPTVVPERVLPRRGASRATKAVEVAQQTSKTSVCVELAAAHVVLSRVADLVSLAKQCRAKVPPAAQSFEKLREDVEAIAEAWKVGDEAGKTGMREALFYLEEAFFGLSGQPEAETSDEEGSEEESQQALSRGRGSRMPRSRSAVSIASCTSTDNAGQKGSKGSAADEVEEYVYESDDNCEERPGHEAWRTARKKTWLYRDIKERRSWISSLEKALRLPCLAYSAGCLLEAVEALAEVLEGLKRKAEGAGSKVANKKARN